jgi:RecT family
MSGMTSAVAAGEQGALAIESGQTRWSEMQLAAFGQLGIKDAPEGDKAVLLHVSQRTGLDPFSRQIYMIGRQEKVPGTRDQWRTKYTIQTGIEGFRVIRGRAEHLEGVRGILSRPVYYDAEGTEYPVWFFQRPPVAVEMTYTVRDRNGVDTPYTSILRFDEYRQTRKDKDDQLVLSGQWAVKPVHMLEKCTEADVYRKAFPQDYSGVDLDDAMPAPDPDAPPVQAQSERIRVTADQARDRRPQTVTATATVVTPDSSPAQAAPPAAAAPVAGAGEDPTTSGASSSAHAPDSGSQQRTAAQSPNSASTSAAAARIQVKSDSPGTVTDPQIKAIWTILGNVFGFKKDEKDEARAVCASIVEHDLPTTTMLSFNEAGKILDILDLWRREAADAAAGARAYLNLMTGQGDLLAEDGTTTDAE